MVELVHDDHVKVVWVEMGEAPAFRLWIDANTWSKLRGLDRPTHFSPKA